MTETEWAYIAGFFDGEGCLLVRIRKCYAVSFYPIVELTQKHREVLDKIQTMLGFGKVHRTKNQKLENTYKYRLIIENMKNVRIFANGVSKYCIVKKPQIDNLLSFFSVADTWRPKDGQTNHKRLAILNFRRLNSSLAGRNTAFVAR